MTTDNNKPLIAEIVNDFQASGEVFELLNTQENIESTQWLENNFPIASWGRIDWSKMPESLCIRYGDDSKLVIAFEKIVEEKQLKGSLVIFWTNARTLPIKISMEVLRKYAEDIFYEEPDTWICNEQDGWCIEHYHDGEICFGRCRTSK